MTVRDMLRCWAEKTPVWFREKETGNIVSGVIKDWNKIDADAELLTAEIRVALAGDFKGYRFCMVSEISGTKEEVAG